MLSKGGPVGGLLAGLLNRAGGGGQAASGKAASGKDGDHSKSVMNFKIQQAMNKRKEINDLISNMLKTMHDMSMTSIRNIR